MPAALSTSVALAGQGAQGYQVELDSKLALEFKMDLEFKFALGFNLNL